MAAPQPFNFCNIAGREQAGCSAEDRSEKKAWHVFWIQAADHADLQRPLTACPTRRAGNSSKMSSPAPQVMQEQVVYSTSSTTSYAACRETEVPRCDGVQVALPSWPWATPLIR